MNKIEPIRPTSFTEAPLPAADVASPRPARSAVAGLVMRVLVRAARRATEKRLAKGKVRTLWAATPILTLPLLARCDRMLGFRSSSLVFNTYYVTRSFDINLILFEGFLRLLRSRSGLGLFRRLVLAWALLRYDIFNYFYDRGLMLSDGRYGINPEELDLLFQSGKRLYTYAYGADVRARDSTLALGHPNLCEECPAPGKFCVCTTEMHASSINRLKGRATAQIAMGDMATYVPDCRDMHYWPIDASKLAAKPPVYKAGDVLKVAHAPNHGHFKGTRLLIEAIDRLVKEGEKIELVSVQGVPNRKVIELFGASHVVADQFVAGFHGYTALEAMAMAKPVLCFLRNDRMMIDPATCPIINTRPDEIYDVLKRCLRRELDLNEIGKAGRRYVEAHYSLQAVAARLGRLYCETAALPEDLRASLTRQVSELAGDDHAS
ncbi:glycosyltransferase [Bradyrhizobium embrapense]|uniref:glycosyltransferase n=1 Tax=Bradyrhizobium embrapense TaxID=630921 RepID=UPI00067D1E10|nr:glycosyltransferase [Bradyrhizobium embrapense]